MIRSLLLSGTYRSGTTLLSRMLSARPECLVVADPFVYFFKAYRNFHMERAGATGWHPDEPFSDHFLARNEEVDRAILESDLSEQVPRLTLARLRYDIRSWRSTEYPVLCKRLGELKRGTFAEMYQQLMELCVDRFAKEETTLAGSRACWSEEFLPALARAFPEMRFVMLLRDLRAIVASQNSRRGAGKRPLLFYARHWRKSVAFARRYLAHDPVLDGRVHLVRYEDLVQRPEEELTALCDHLDVPFSPEMMQVSAFRTEVDEQPWRPNSAYADGGEGIYANSVERWRDTLSRDEIEALEALVGPELALLGYELPETVRDPLECLGLDCEPRSDELPRWMQRFRCAAYLDDVHGRTCEYAAESVRRSLLEEHDRRAADRTPGDLEGHMFLDANVLADLRAAWRERLRPPRPLAAPAA